MSTSGLSDNAVRLLRARTFLFSRKASLYGGRSLLFALEKSYRSFDDMLKRSVLFCRFGVREVVAEARAELDGASATLVVHRQAGLTPAKGGASSFEDLVRTRRLIPTPGAPRKKVDLGGRLHEVDILASGPDHLTLKLLPLPIPANKGFRESSRSLRKAWIQALLTEWIGVGSPLHLEGGPDHLSRAPFAKSQSMAWTVSRRISQVDIDISGEEIPHVFRWKETTLAQASTYADLDESDIAAALSTSGVILPSNAHRQGRLQEDLGRGGACLLLRYAHLIPDPDPGADGNMAMLPPQMSAGHIAMENDYLEILIDAGTGKVFSEARKWRPDPDGADLAPSSLTLDAQAA